MSTYVHATPDATRADLAESLRYLNERAKGFSRRGPQGWLHPDYAQCHRNINALLYHWQLAER